MVATTTLGKLKNTLTTSLTPSRYDYEEVDAKGAGDMMKHLLELQKTLQKGSPLEGFTIETADEFSYTDPVDGSVSARQVRF